MNLTTQVLMQYAPVLAIGLSIALGSGALFKLLGSRYLARGIVHSRTRREPPPPLWRMVWWIIRALAIMIDPFIPAWLRRQADAQLRGAGMDLSLSASEFTAGRALCAMVAAGLAALALAPSTGLWIVWVFGFFGAWLPQTRLRDLVSRRQRRISRDLPMMLDLICMAVQGGTTVSVAIALAVEQGPRGPLRDEMARVLREIKAGRQRHQALRAMADRYPIVGLRHAIGAIISAERQGADLTRVLRGQSEQRRQERFLEAERLAMQAPVKMLLPLVVFVFPGTFLILMFPVAMQLLGAGLL